MASPEDAEPQIWRPRTSAEQRLAASPQDFRHFRRGDRVGVFLGCAWTGGVVDQVGSTSVLVRARRLGCRQPTSMRVCDARNLVPRQELRAPDAGSQESQGGVL
jgi:hypothetical protein